MECADVPDVSNTVRSGDLSNVVSLAEALWQCKLGFSTDKMVGDNKVLTARCRFSVPAECQNTDHCVGNRCGSHCVCRDKATPTVVHLNDYTCECDSGFELKSTARVAALSVAIDNVDHVLSNAIKFEETVTYECHVQRLQSQFRDG